jgi:hypothetical protein
MSASSAAVQSVAAPFPSGAARAALREAVGVWAARARREAFPLDRLWVYFACGACEARYQAIIQLPNSPWTSGDAPPLYWFAEDVEALLESALGARLDVVGEEEWARASECSCRAPKHHRQAIASALFHDVLGTGAAVVAARLGERVEWLRAPDGSAEPAPFEPASFETVFGRPLSLFDAWRELATKLPVPEGTVSGVLVEPGVLLFAAPNEPTLRAGITAKLGPTRRFSVSLDASAPESLAWPSPLRRLALHIGEGTALALVVERDAMLAQARTWARSRLDGSVLELGSDEWAYVGERGRWTLAPANIALTMARSGRTLAEGCAHAIDEAARSIEDRIATLEAMIALLPGSSFVVDGTRATAHRSDGGEGRTVELETIPVGAGSLPREALVREASYLFDVAPQWADRTRVCSCGAAASLERRLVPWPFTGDEDDRPWVLAMWGDSDRARAAEVLAICCDHHVRVPSERELRSHGVDDLRIRAASVLVSRLRVRAHVWSRGEERIVLVQGPFASGVIVSDARMRALCDALGRPVAGERARAWAIGTDVLALAQLETSDESIPPALSELGIPIHGAFWIRREIDLTVDPVGSFDVVAEGR